MKPGVYVAGREITNDVNVPITHQFVVLVPKRRSSVDLEIKEYLGVNYSILGAYNIGGYLRAQENAQSDEPHLKKYLLARGKEGAEVSVVETGMCYVDDDTPIREIFDSYRHFKKFEGRSDELVYPKDIGAQLNSGNYNSNSWAQSLVFWAIVAGSKAKNDFKGIDLGRQRLIPKKYFRD